MRVAIVSQPEYFCYHYREGSFKDIEVKHFDLTWSQKPECYSDLIRYKPDILVAFRGELLPITVLEKLDCIKVALSSEPFPKIQNGKFEYTKDSLDRFKFFLQIFDLPYDYIFHYDQVSETFLESQGITLSGFFQFPIDTKTYAPSGRSEKKWDIFFIGRSTPHREDIFGRLKRDFKFLHINHGIYGKDLLPYINSSKICLNVHSVPELSWEPRVQILLSCGATVVSEAISDNPYIKPGEHFVSSPPESFYDICQSILMGERDVSEIAEKGMKTVLKHFNFEKFFPNFISAISRGDYKKPRFNEKMLNIGPLEICAKYNGFDHLLDRLLVGIE